MNAVIQQWLTTAHKKGKRWYQQYGLSVKQAEQRPLKLSECYQKARSVATAGLVMTWMPTEAHKADWSHFIDAFVAGAVEAWHELEGRDSAIREDKVAV
ncbi:MAG: hypothetical protein IT324_30300 [Anaerolineae bacterium]|nr:hypothetical protein [Anaerolineae bacterium]